MTTRQATMEESIRGQIAYLREENDKLREQLAFVHAALMDSSEYWGNLGLKLTGQQELILRTLYKREMATREMLLVAMYSDRPDCDWADAKIIDVQVCRVRAALPQRDFVENVWGRGYRLTPEGRKWIKQRLELAEPVR